jgi:hypothetical protein
MEVIHHHVKREVLRRVKEKRKYLYRIQRIKDNWITHILGKNCSVKHVIEGKIEGMGRRG